MRLSSGTAALHAALDLLDLKSGEEVIVPAMTFVATANVVLYQGGVPVFADVQRDTLLIDPERGPHYLGHNPIQQFSYTFVYLIVLVQVTTGFTLYGQSNPEGFLYNAFHWVIPLLGGLQIVRFVHHVMTWLFLIFIPIHVYLALRSDVMDREGTMSSIFSGGRFVRADVEYEDESDSSRKPL